MAPSSLLPARDNMQPPRQDESTSPSRLLPLPLLPSLLLPPLVATRRGAVAVAAAVAGRHAVGQGIGTTEAATVAATDSAAVLATTAGQESARKGATAATYETTYANDATSRAPSETRERKSSRRRSPCCCCVRRSGSWEEDPAQRWTAGSIDAKAASSALMILRWAVEHDEASRWTQERGEDRSSPEVENHSISWAVDVS